MSIWTIFQTATDALDTPLRAAVDGEIDALFPPRYPVLSVWPDDLDCDPRLCNRNGARR